MTCGTQPDEKAWFFMLDSVKFTCAGFQELGTPSAPHATRGEYFLEIDDDTGIKYRHHYLAAMQNTFGTSWNVTDLDVPFVDSPEVGGHGPTSGFIEYWHPCASISATCH